MTMTDSRAYPSHGGDQSDNVHIFDYIDDYIELPQPPQAAVLINGPWGIGKSFAVNSYIASLKSRSKTVIYVSLYGVKATEDIDTMLLTGAHTLLDNTIARYGLRFAKAAFKKITFGTEAKLADFLPKSNIDLIIFDDLERALMPATEVLGYINTFVEHDDLPVLIVCNEAEMKDQDTYRLIREKVVGIAFDLQPQERPALAAFISQISEPEARAFLEAHSEEALAIFRQSETCNLRLLQQTVWAWSRLFKHIDKGFRDRARGMLTAFRLFVALSIEIKAGRISREDLQNRVAKIVAGSKENPTPLSSAQNRYKLIYLHDTVLNDEVLQQILCEGRHEREAINQSLARSEYFLKPDEEPAWQKVWHGITRDAVEFEAAFTTMEEQFAARIFTDGAEILHVMGLRLWCLKIGQLACSEADVVADGKAYIDDLFASKKLETGYTKDTFSSRFTGAYGLSFYEAGTPAFNELVTYYVERCKEAIAASWPNKLAPLLDLMSTDTDAFFAQICWTNDDRDNTYAYVPILSAADANDFVRRMLECRPAQQRTIFTALEGRYEANRLASELTVERDWLAKVRDALLTYADAPDTPPIRRFAIRNDVERILNPLLS